jgi:pilus assembly protein CpaF
VRTIVCLSATRGVLGEAVLVKNFARAFSNERETFDVLLPRDFQEPGLTTNAEVDWRFAFDDIEGVGQEMGVILMIVPTVHGVAWAQRQKNELILKGIPASRIAALVLFSRERGALSSSLIERTIGMAVDTVPCSLDRLFSAHNDGARDETPALNGVLKAAGAVRERFERAWMMSDGADVPWRSIEKEVLRALWSTDASAVSLSQEHIAQRLRAHMAACLQRRRLTAVNASLLQQLERRLVDHVTGLGPLEPFLRDPDVNEIMIVGTSCLYVERQGRMVRVPPPFDHEAHLKALIERIVAPSGRRVDWAAPFCDVRLKDGSRVNIVLPPLALDGPCVTIRRFRPGFSSLENLETAGTIDPDQSRRLRRAVLERKNIVVAGNTGAGKTTLLNVLAALIPDTERILTLEDAAELSVGKPHVVRLETRSANTEGKGQITMRDLVVNALRMRPDRLLIGECRGDEVIPMLQAMNTGHDGSMTTLHANSAEEVGPRLESLVSMSAPSWSLDLVRQQIRSAFDVIVYMRRDGAHRRVTEVRDVV